MGRGSAGTATLRHVGFVALEALLIAGLVWIAAMTLAGAGQSNALVGAAQAGLDTATISVVSTHGKPAIVSTANAPDGAWVHLSCSRDDVVVVSRWGRLDPKGHATVALTPPSAWTASNLTCSAEIGDFSPSGHWRQAGTTSFRPAA
jgi:hypothetical protein